MEISSSSNAQTGRASPARRGWWRSGDPWIWLTATAVSGSVLVVIGLLVLIAARGMGHFWPASLVQINYTDEWGTSVTLLGEVVDRYQITRQAYDELNANDAGAPADFVDRWLLKVGNRDRQPQDFRWIFPHRITQQSEPPDALAVERMEWGNAYGVPIALLQLGTPIASRESIITELRARLQRVERLRQDMDELQTDEIADINYQIEQLRLQRRRIELGTESGVAVDVIQQQENALHTRYAEVEARLGEMRVQAERDVLRLRLSDGQESDIPLGQVVKFWQPNTMSVADKLGFYASSYWSFLSEPPREANTEGGIFPAIFGTVLMVLLMSVLVTPFGVVAAIYLREYAHQGPIVRIIRIAVNNLAGVPSIVYGVFGLGFLVYFVGAGLDEWLFAESLPTPTFGTPGLLWAAITLAILTVPVVIVSTEEGLARIPRSVREGSLALGATKAETLFRVILPMASPSILTGVILAIARAAGEVAPLMLVGVVKLAPQLPLDGTFPFLHLERKFMHLGFHIYDVGFQSPNVDAARPIVYATAFLLVVIILVLNLTAILLRSRLEKQFRALE